VLGTIHPSFLQLPLPQGEQLGIPGCEEKGCWRAIKGVHRLETGKIMNGPQSALIQYYGQATWAGYGSWSYQTVIYMLNHITQLQAVVKS
jgi:hypothetical protein